MALDKYCCSSCFIRYNLYGLFEVYYPASAFLSEDENIARNPQYFINANVNSITFQ